MTIDPYATLARRFERIAIIGEANGMLSWDSSAMMPEGGSASRGDQMATLAGLAHEMLVGAETEDLLGRADAPPGSDEARNLALMRHRVRRARAIPSALVEARTKAEIDCEQVWRGARADDDVRRVLPALHGLLGLVREEAGLLGAAIDMSPYDALMDGFQPGVMADAVEPVFARYAAFLVDALPAIEARQAAEPAPLPLPTPAPEASQEELCRTLSARIGLDYAHARLDRSLHPFCGGTPDDVRITTRYEVDDPSRALLGVLHETGHALYERGLPPAWRRQPIGEAAGMATHESQSLIVEMQACRSDAFLRFLGPMLEARFGAGGGATTPANLARLWRRVGRTLIRVDADEVTYPAHVMMRFRLERALVAGDLAVADLPGAWSDGLHALLGIRPPDDRSGCLQDIHWYAGLFGYFPSYSLGAMAAAQLMAACRKATPGLDAALEAGDLAPLLGWLRANVHAHGHRYGFAALLERATGAPLDPDVFIAHIRARYLAPG